MEDPFVLDTFALLSFFNRERGWRKVKGILEHKEATQEKVLLSRINWGEFYYISRRGVGKAKAQKAVAVIEKLPIKVISVDDDIVKEAAEIKSEHPVSYADAFCVALAMRFNAIVVTGDPEFRQVEHLVKVM